MILALDVDGTFIKWAVAKNYDLIRQGKTPTPQHSFEEFLQAIHTIIAENSDVMIEGIAMSYPGMEDPETKNLIPFGALTYGLGKPVRKLVEQEFNIPVTMENDGRLAALAEMRLGSLTDVSSGYLLVIGTGIGGAYVNHGKIETGKHGYAGQISLFLVDSLRRKGLSAIWSSHNGMPGFLNHVKEVTGTEMNGETFMERVRNHDDVCNALLDEYMETFTDVLFTLQMVLDPERFVIGGGISADETFISRMQKKYEEIYSMYNIAVPHADIVTCRYHNTSNIIGALVQYYETNETVH